MVEQLCIQLTGRRRPAGGAESPGHASTCRNKHTRCLSPLAPKKKICCTVETPFGGYVAKQKHKLELKTRASFPTVAEHGCLLILVLGERVIRLKATAATGQLLALLVKQFLVMWADKLVHPWETGHIHPNAKFFLFCLSEKYQRWYCYPAISQRTHLWRDRGYWRPQLRPPSLTVGLPSCPMSCSSAGPLLSAQRRPGWGISSSRWGKSLPCSFYALQTHPPHCLFSTRCKDRRTKYQLKAPSCLHLLQSVDKHIRGPLKCPHVCPEGLHKDQIWLLLNISYRGGYHC